MVGVVGVSVAVVSPLDQELELLPRSDIVGNDSVVRAVLDYHYLGGSHTRVESDHTR